MVIVCNEKKNVNESKKDRTNSEDLSSVNEEILFRSKHLYLKRIPIGPEGDLLQKEKPKLSALPASLNYLKLPVSIGPNAPIDKHANCSYKTTNTRMDGKYVNSITLEPLVATRLLDYQIKGVQWLWNLRLQGTGGVLADEMGLGKTVQVCIVDFLRS